MREVDQATHRQAAGTGGCDGGLGGPPVVPVPAARQTERFVVWVRDDRQHPGHVTGQRRPL